MKKTERAATKKHTRVNAPNHYAHTCPWCAGKMGREYWDVNKFVYMRECLKCKRESEI